MLPTLVDLAVHPFISSITCSIRAIFLANDTSATVANAQLLLYPANIIDIRFVVNAARRREVRRTQEVRKTPLPKRTILIGEQR